MSIFKSKNEIVLFMIVLGGTLLAMIAVLLVEPEPSQAGGEGESHAATGAVDGAGASTSGSEGAGSRPATGTASRPAGSGPASRPSGPASRPAATIVTPAPTPRPTPEPSATPAPQPTAESVSAELAEAMPETPAEPSVAQGDLRLRPANDGVLTPAEVTLEALMPVETYQSLLDAYVRGRGVDYEALVAQGRDDLTRVTDAMAEAKARIQTAEVYSDPASHEYRTLTAFLINAYNALTLETIVDHYPLNSIMDIDKPWDTPLPFMGREATLNEIEHEMLRLNKASEEMRRQFVDPRLHFAVNCASVGCPILQPVVFTADNVEELYDQGVRDFMSDPTKYRLENGTLHISQLLDWYGEDFQLQFENADAAENLRRRGVDNADKWAAVGTFFAEYEDDSATAEALRSGEFWVELLEYDWSLNRAAR
ncbi:MAG: DUF547 domain-containing protein [Sumerlaeia bacterium]